MARTTTPIHRLATMVFGAACALTLAPIGAATAGATVPASSRVALPIESVVPSSADVAFVEAAFDDFLDRQPTSTELGAATRSSLQTGAARSAWLTTLDHSSTWVANVVQQLYENTLGRPADPGGLAYWSQVLTSGAESVAQVAAAFYASDEYFNGIGGATLTSWVGDLYTKILHRTADPTGLTYWADTAASNGRWTVAYAIEQSLESRNDRVTALYEKLLGRSPDPGGLTYWANRVATDGDLALAGNLASSNEYFSRAWLRYGTEAAGTWQSLPSSTNGTATVGVAFAGSSTGPVFGEGGPPDMTAATGPEAFSWATPTTTPTAMIPPPLAGARGLMLGGATATGELWGSFVDAQGNYRGVVWSSPSATPEILTAPAPFTDLVPMGMTDDGEFVGEVGVGVAGAFPRTMTGLVWSSPTDPSPTQLRVPTGFGGLDQLGVSHNGVIFGSGASGALVWTSPTATPVRVATSDPNVAIAGVTDSGAVVGTIGTGTNERVEVWGSPTDTAPTTLPLPAGVTSINRIVGVTPSGEIVADDNGPGGYGDLVWASLSDPTPTVVAPPTGYTAASLDIAQIDETGDAYGSAQRGSSPPDALVWVRSS
ncbi:MAG: DUF4214 domain-containing protein [Actinobacteria bacterium]|nr:DUF4214 domain-containing protein [Actinomycetota bacterium]